MIIELVTQLLMGDGKGSWGGGQINWDPCGMVVTTVLIALVIMALRSRRGTPG